MKRRYILLLLSAMFTVQGFAQTDGQAYRRSSIYSVLINHTDQQFADEIRQAFNQIPVPDKFNDHNLSVRVVEMGEKLNGASSNKENSTVTDFLRQNMVASRLVGRWFNRDKYTGACNMELVKERGLYNANEFDRQIAMHSARGIAMLQDAGEDLIGNTYVLVNDIHYIDKSKGSSAVGTGLSILGGIVGSFVGANYRDLTRSATNVATAMAKSFKGFSVKINTFLYKLNWNEEQANLFYQEQYGDGKDMTKKQNFDDNRGQWTLEYVGKVESRGGTTSFLGIGEDQPVLMVRKACQRAIDENIVDLQRNYEGFRIKTPLVSVEPLTAYIGMKEGVTSDSRFEVLQPVEMENGTIKYEKVGEIAPIKNLIWDNRFMAEEEGATGASLGFTTFKVVSGKDFSKGMLIRELGD